MEITFIQGLNIHFIALLIGFLLDKLFGDPTNLPHPVIWFGKAISFFEKKWNHGKNQVLKGAFTTLFLVGLVWITIHFLIHFAYKFYVGIAIESLFIFYGLAGTTLIREGKAVFRELDKSLDAGRKQVGRIVGRDTTQLSYDQVCAATLETLAENLSDGVIAPLFWYAIAGLPGMMAYKMVNTLDSMIGYKNDRYLKFGRFAARLDDFANFIPARITALLMALCSGSLRAATFVFKYGKAHSSPNAGYPEAALAGILNTRFGGIHIYFGKEVAKPFIGEIARPFTKNDLKKTILVNRLVEYITVLIILILAIYEYAPITK